MAFYFCYSTDPYSDDFMDGFDRVVGPFQTEEDQDAFLEKLERINANITVSGVDGFAELEGSGKFCIVQVDYYGDEVVGPIMIVDTDPMPSSVMVTFVNNEDGGIDITRPLEGSLCEQDSDDLDLDDMTGTMIVPIQSPDDLMAEVIENYGDEEDEECEDE